MTTETPRPTFTVPSPIGDLAIRADSGSAVVVDLDGTTINGVAYKGNAYAHHVRPSQVRGIRPEGDDARAWTVGSFTSGELVRYDGLYLRRAQGWDDPTPAASKKARAVVEDAVAAWAATDEGAAALAAADERQRDHLRAVARNAADELRGTAELIERVARAVADREAIRIDYREAHRFKDSRAGFGVAYWYAGEDRAVTVTPYDAAVPSDWRTPEGLR